MNKSTYLARSIELSKQSIKIGGYPVGAVIVHNGQIIAEGLSDGKQICDATSHAEVAAIREASRKLGRRNLDDVVLYTSLEPCVMCFTASFWAYIPKVVFICSRKRVSPDYYEGNHDIKEINKNSRRQIELIHYTELEEQALQIINDWEKVRN